MSIHKHTGHLHAPPATLANTAAVAHCMRGLAAVLGAQLQCMHVHPHLVLLVLADGWCALHVHPTQLGTATLDVQRAAPSQWRHVLHHMAEHLGTTAVQLHACACAQE